MAEHGVDLGLTDDVELDLTSEEVETPQYGGSYNSLLAGMGVLSVTPPDINSDPNAQLQSFKASEADAKRFTTVEGEALLRFQAAVTRGSANVETLSEALAGGIAALDETELETRSQELLATEQGALTDRYALEANTLDKLESYALRDPDGIDVAVDEAIDPGPLDEMRARIMTSMVMRNAMEKVQVEIEDRSTVNVVFDALARMVPFNKWTSVDNLIDSVIGKASGTILKEASDNLNMVGPTLSPLELQTHVDQMVQTLRDNSGILFGENLPLVLENLSQVQAISEGDVRFENVLDWIDVATTLPILTATRITKAGLAVRSRSRELGKAVQLDAHIDNQAGKLVDDIDDVINNSMPDAAKGAPTDMNSMAGVSDEVNRVLEGQSQLGDAVIESLNRRAKALTEEEELSMIDGITDDILTRYDGAYVKNVQIDNTRTIPRTSVLIGEKNGGYISEGSAKTGATKKGLNPENVHKDPDGRWYIEHSFDNPDGNYLKMEKTIADSPSWLGWLTRGKLGTAGKFVDDLVHGKAIQADLIKSGLHSTVNQLIKTGWSPLKKGQRDSVLAVLGRGNQEGRWYNINEFHANFTDLHNGRVPTQGEVLGYYTAKNLNDFDYTLRNHGLYKDLVRGGWEQGSIRLEGEELLRGRVKVLDGMPTNFRGAFYDVANDTTLTAREVAEESLNARMASKGEILVQLEEHRVFNGQPSNMILMKKSQLSDRAALDYRQLLYNPGGHRIYDGQFWVKQARVGTFKGSTRKYVLRPLTHIVAKTKKEAAEWGGNMEHLRNKWNSMEANDITRAEFETAAREVDIDPQDWERWVRDDEIDLGNPFEVVHADDNIPTGQSQAFKDNPDLVDMSQEISPSASFLQDNGRLFYSQKGSIKRGPQDEMADLIDPMASINRGIESAIRLASYGEYRARAVNGWVHQYGHLLEKKGLSREQIFWSDENILRKGGDEKVRLAADMARSSIKRQLSQGNEYMRAWKSAMRSGGEWFEGKALPGVAKKIYDASSRDPISAMKGISFDLKLGMFDPSQLLVQTQTAAAMTFLDPLRAGGFIWDGMWMRRLAHNHTDEFLNYAAKKSNMEAGEFKAMVGEMNESGILNISGELVLLDHHATAIKSSIGEGAQKLRDVGRIPFYEAERLNRLYAYRKAWSDMRLGGTFNDKVIKAKSVDEILTPTGRSELARLTDKYTNNMIAGSAAAWQKGALSIPSQFMSYQFRLMENILPTMMGGNKAFSTGEKLRLALSQFVLYGAAGVPAGEYFLRQATEAGLIDAGETDEKAKQTAYRALAGGFWDSMLYAVTGGELDLAPSKRLAVNQGLEDFVTKIFGANTYDDFSPFQFVAGAPGAVLGDVTSDAIDGLKAVWLAAQSEKVDLMDVSERALRNIAENASSYSRLHKAMLVWQYGYTISQETGRRLAPATTMEAFATWMGIQTRDMVNIEQMRLSMDEEKAEVKKVRKRVSEVRQELWRAIHDKDEDTITARSRELNGILGLYPLPMRMKILRGISSNRDLKPLIETTQEQFQKSFNPQIFPSPNTDEGQR